jgi:glucose-1-phosphatase
MFDHWSKVTSTPSKELRTRFQFDQDLEKFECGTITPSDYHLGLCKNLEVSFSYEDFVFGWNSIYQEVNSEVELCLQQLKGKLSVVAFTNTNEIHCLIWPKRYAEVLRNFDHVFASSKLGIRKPDGEAFMYVLKQFGKKPEETIFFDDFLPNIEAAKKLGIQTVYVNSPSTVRNELTKQGLIE